MSSLNDRAKRLRFAEWSSQHVGRPYVLGKNDCLSLVLDLCAHLDVPTPHSFWYWQPLEGSGNAAWMGSDEVSREDYPELYRSDPKAAKEVFLRFVESVGMEVDAAKAFTGDVLIGRPKARDAGDGPWSIVIHAGGDRIMTAYNAPERRRVDLGPLRAYRVMKAFRIGETRNG